MQALRCNNTKVGCDFRSHPQLLFTLAIVGLATVAADLSIVTAMRADALQYDVGDQWRTTIGLVWLLLAVGLVTEADLSPQNLGLSWRVTPNLGFWLKAVPTMLAVLGVILLACATVYRWFYGVWPDVPSGTNSFWSERLFWSCVFAPLWEEIIYRQAVCVWLAPLVGATLCIVIDGALFGGLHFLYGNPSPDNFIAGYFLAWAFLKSGTLWLPILLHASGNLVAYVVQFYFGQSQ